MTQLDTEQLRLSVIDTLKTVFDPEIPVNIYDMGMIYEVRVEQNGYAYVEMTLTTPACPVAGTLPGEVELKVAGVEGVTDAKVELVWDPPWTQAMLSEAARLQLGLM
ncbi:MAG: DUF59 domain-containing protein [Planctomycetota bacterium]|jgi:FeS assembly SUF system protein